MVDLNLRDTLTFDEMCDISEFLRVRCDVARERWAALDESGPESAAAFNEWWGLEETCIRWDEEMGKTEFTFVSDHNDDQRE